MIEIYKLVGDYEEPRFERVALWEDGRFTFGFEGEKTRDDVLHEYNQGYYRTNEIA